MTTLQIILMLKVLKVLTFVTIGACAVTVPILLYLLWRMRNE